MIYMGKQENKLKNFMREILFDLLPYIPGRISKRIYSKYIGRSEFKIHRNVCFASVDKCEIEKQVFINHGYKFYAGYAENADKMISIAENVWSGMNTMFVYATHNIGNSEQRAGEIIYKPIKVEDGCWIGRRWKCTAGNYY